MSMMLGDSFDPYTFDSTLYDPGFHEHLEPPYSFDHDPTQFHVIYQPAMIPQSMPPLPSEYSTDSSTSSDSIKVEDNRVSPITRKRSPSSEANTCLSPPPKRTRRLEQPQQTAETRKKGACINCQNGRQQCAPGPDPDGPCMRCIQTWNKRVTNALVHQPCWRVKLSDVEVFRRGPTLTFAWSMRWANAKADASGKGSWKPFKKAITNVSTRRQNTSRTVQLTQGWTSNTLAVEVDRYVPLPTDKQYYEWFDNGVAKQYPTPPFSIAYPDDANHAIERFLNENMEEYVNSHMINATAITTRQFKMALRSRDKPLVHKCLQLWVACRFIEKPWHLTGAETLDMTPDPNTDSPYHSSVPVTPIMDLQIDLLVIHQRLQPLLNEIRELLDTRRHRVKSERYRDWHEVQLAYFILIHNIERTFAHDLAFARRYNLSGYSNTPLINMIVHGANTLLTYFHHAHQGYAPFSEPWAEVENTEGLSREQKEHLRDMRELIANQRGEHVHSPSKELFWTSQLFKPDWRPVVMVM